MKWDRDEDVWEGERRSRQGVDEELTEREGKIRDKAVFVGVERATHEWVVIVCDHKDAIEGRGCAITTGETDGAERGEMMTTEGTLLVEATLDPTGTGPTDPVSTSATTEAAEWKERVEDGLFSGLCEQGQL